METFIADGKYGLIDDKGQVLMPAQFDYIEIHERESTGLQIVKVFFYDWRHLNDKI